MFSHPRNNEGDKNEKELARLAILVFETLMKEGKRSNKLVEVIEKIGIVLGEV